MREIARAHEDTVVLMIAGVDDADVAALAIESGAFGYLIKPVSVNVLQIAVHNALRRRELEIENRNHRRFLERMVAERTAELRGRTTSGPSGCGSPARCTTSARSRRRTPSSPSPAG